MRGVAYKAVLLCLLVVLNEFGPAHFMCIDSSSTQLSNKRNFRDEEEFENENYDDEVEEGAAKRSAASVLFKVVKFGSDFFPKITTFAGMISTIYLLIEQCCGGKWKDVCTWNEEVETIRNELDTKGNEIENMELEIKNLQASLISAKRDFSQIVLKMNEIGKASGHLLKKLDPQMEIALNKTSNEMKLLIKQKQETGEKVKYVDVETEFFGVMDGILGVAVPMFTTIIPSVPKLIKWAKARMGRYKVYELDHSVDAKAIEAPDINDAKYHSSKSWFGKQIKQITYQVDVADYKLQTKYKKAYDVFQKVKKYFGIVTGYAGAAYSIYVVYNKFKKCDSAYEEAKKAVGEMRKAKEKMQEIYDATVASRQQMFEARDVLKVNLTEGVFIKDLEELKASLDKIKGHGVDQNFLDVLDAIGRYITEAPNARDSAFVEAESLLRMLYENLYKIPKYYDCYSDKVSVVSTVLRRCQEGDHTLKKLTEMAKDAKDMNWQSCQTMIGMEPITDQKLQDLIDEQAEKKGFNKVCELNSKARKDTVCFRKCDTKYDVKETAEFLDVDEDVVKILQKGCKLCESVEEAVCFLREMEVTNQEIQEKTYPQYTLKEIRNITCNEKR